MADYSTFINSVKEIDIVKGVYAHPNGTAEQDVIIITANKNNVEVSLDMINLLQNTTIRVYEKVDDVTYRPTSEKIWPTEFPSNIEDLVINLNGKDIDQKITFQSGTAEGSIKNVPHARVENVRSDSP